MSTEIAETERAELAKQDEALAAGALAQIDSKDLVLPVVKVTQQLSREVTDGDVESGRFVNSLTGEDYGDEVEIVVSHYFKGRFYAPEDEDRVYVASGPVAPPSWPEEFAGKPFADIPVAEETWKARANDPDDEFEFGSGPTIQTTHNYIGFLPTDPGVPVRVSLKGTSTRTARKINSLLSFQARPWNATLKLSTAQRENKRKQPYFVVEVARGEQTDEEQRSFARSLAKQAQTAQYTLVGDAPEEKAKREAPAAPAGGIAV